MATPATPESLPDLDGLYTHSEEHTYSGYNTDLEEMDSWSEWEVAFLHFAPGGDVRCVAGTDDDRHFANQEAEAKTATTLPTREPNGSWTRAELDGRVGYIVRLELPYGVPVFWNSHGGPSEVFLWWEDGELNAQRFWTEGGWGQTTRILQPWTARP